MTPIKPDHQIVYWLYDSLDVNEPYEMAIQKCKTNKYEYPFIKITYNEGDPSYPGSHNGPLEIYCEEGVVILDDHRGSITNFHLNDPEIIYTIQRKINNLTEAFNESL